MVKNSPNAQCVSNEEAKGPAARTSNGSGSTHGWTVGRALASASKDPAPFGPDPGTQMPGRSDPWGLVAISGYI
jgi:hypothetical protein